MHYTEDNIGKTFAMYITCATIGIIIFVYTIVIACRTLGRVDNFFYNKGAKLRIERIKLDIEEHKLIRQRHKALNTDLAVYKSEYKAPEETDKKHKQK